MSTSPRTPPKPYDTLLSYIEVQEKFDRKLYSVLSRAASDAARDVRLLAERNNIGSIVRRGQMELIQQQLHIEMASIMTKAGRLIEADKHTAAAAAIDAMSDYDEFLSRALVGDAAKHFQAYLRSAVATADFGMEAAIQRMQGGSYIPLADSVYKTTQLVNGQVDRLVESALTRGLSARELAREVAQYIKPNVSGGVSYAALRLGRTEINNAFHAVQAQKARDTPWTTGMQWHLSGSHTKPDLCNEYAETAHFKGGERGVFKPNEVPMKPHPNCLCFTTPVTVSDEEFLDRYFRGEYDEYMDGIIGRAA